jgi:hypothetical protein
MTDDAFVYYSNYADVTHSLLEFALTFGRLPPKMTVAQLEDAQATGTITADAAVQVLLPVGVVKGLIDALSLQFSHYQEFVASQNPLTPDGGPT